jgi:hypothetical protein
MVWKGKLFFQINKFEKIEKIDLSCQFVYDGEIKLQGKGGQGEPYMYSINGGKSFSYTKNYKNLDTGKYHVMVKDANHCNIGDSAYVGFKDKIEINAFPKDTTIELGQRVEIDFDVIKTRVCKMHERSCVFYEKILHDSTPCKGKNNIQFISFSRKSINLL